MEEPKNEEITEEVKKEGRQTIVIQIGNNENGILFASPAQRPQRRFAKSVTVFPNRRFSQRIVFLVQIKPCRAIFFL